MKRITPDELPEILTDDIIDILVDMAREFPKFTRDWINVSTLLEKRGQLKMILDRVQDLEKEKRTKEEEERLSKMTKEEIEIEREKWKKRFENINPNGFYGNMGEPETVEEYKNRYGVYPPGYNKLGEKDSLE